MPPGDFLDADDIRHSSFVRHVEIYDELGSTNDHATELSARADIELPTLVVARRQTAGRGRGDHRWWAADGALTFSLLIEPAAYGVTTQDWPRLSLAVAVAICAALTEHLRDSNKTVGDCPDFAESSEQNGTVPFFETVLLGSLNHPVPEFSKNPAPPPRLAIKWPNDVFLDGAKVAGVLIESPGGPGSTRGRMVIGIGINVNNSRLAAPREAGPNVTALCDASSTTHDLNRVLISVLRPLEAAIQQLATGDPALPAAWQRLCWLTEQEVEVNSGGEVFAALCLGITEDGALLVETTRGKQRLQSGSVKAAATLSPL